MTRAHIIYITYKIFRETIEKGTKCPNVKENLSTLAMIYALEELRRDSIPNYETGYFKAGTNDLLLEAMKKALDRIRPQMIPLVETFGIPDSMLVSCIGNSYGDIYETQLEWARNSRLNKNLAPPGFMENIMPIVKGKL